MKLSQVKVDAGSPAYPSYPGRTNFSYISIQNFEPFSLNFIRLLRVVRGENDSNQLDEIHATNRLDEKQNVGSTHLAGSPFFDGKVILLTWPSFLHININTLACSAASTRSMRDNQSTRECCWLGKKGELFSHINARLVQSGADHYYIRSLT